MKIIGQILLILGYICMWVAIINGANNPRDAIAPFVFSSYDIVLLFSGGFSVLIGSIFTAGGAIIDELRELRECDED